MTVMHGKVVLWSQTSRGGKSVDWIRLEPARACESAYGLCGD